jgi:hypothetical protein
MPLVDVDAGFVSAVMPIFPECCRPAILLPERCLATITPGTIQFPVELRLLSREDELKELILGIISPGAAELWTGDATLSILWVEMIAESRPIDV